MIVRILGEGQFSVAEGDAEEVRALDAALASAIEANDEAAFGPALAALVARLHEVATPLPEDEIATSEIVVPFSDATLAETLRLLDAEADR